MSAFTETTHDNSAVCEQKSVAVATERIRLSTAIKHSDGNPVVRVGKLYITGMERFDEVSIIDKEGYITGHISMRKLDRLGNGNWAKPDPTKSTMMNTRTVYE